MDDINYPTAYAMYEIKNVTGYDQFGFPIYDTECYVVMPCYITRHTIKYDYDGKIHEEYEVIFMKKQDTYNNFIDVEDVIFEESQIVSFISQDYNTMKQECNKENKKILIRQFSKLDPVNIAKVRDEFFTKQEILQDKVNGNNNTLKYSRKDYNE